MALSYCDTAGCAGHLGKFDDCVSEAVWQETLNGGTCDTTGSVEFDGFYALVPFTEVEAVKLSDGPTVTVPAGWYVARENSQGFVAVDRYDTEGDAREIFDDANTRYDDWLDADE